MQVTVSPESHGSQKADGWCVQGRFGAQQKATDVKPNIKQPLTVVTANRKIKLRSAFT